MTSAALQQHRAAQNDHREFMAFVADEESQAAVAAITEKHWPASVVQLCDIGQTLHMLGDIETPRLLVIDLSGAADPIQSVTGLAEVCDPGTSVIALGDVNDVALFRELIEIGVSDYLVKPIDSDMLNKAILRARTPAPSGDEAADAETDGGDLAIVIGTRGGVGASAVAVSVAWELAERLERRTALIDLDLQFGTASLSLDLEAGRGLREALENPSRIDGLFLASAAANPTERLSVLGAEEPLDAPLSYGPAALELVLEELRESFDHVIVDMPRSAAPNQRHVLDLADDVIIVSDLTLTGLRDAMRLKEFVATAAPGAKVTMVGNRAGNKRAGELSQAEFERGLEGSLDFVVPDDVKAMSKAAASGKPLSVASADGKTARQLINLAKHLAKIEAAEPAWKRIWPPKLTRTKSD